MKTRNRYSRCRAFQTPKELKKKAKVFYIQKDECGLPKITTAFSIKPNTKCFNNFGETYTYWLKQIKQFYPNTLIVEVDASKFYNKQKSVETISYAFKILRGNKQIRNVACAYGIIPQEKNEIGMCGIGEIIGATYALKEVLDLLTCNDETVIIRYDNKFIKSVANGKLPDVNIENRRYIQEYLRVYRSLCRHVDVSFHHVYSHVGDDSHDGIDEQAKKANRRLEKALAI